MLPGVLPPALDLLRLQAAIESVVPVDVGDLELSPAGRLESRNDVEDVRRVAVEANDGMCGGRGVVAEVDDPENFGVVVYEDGRVADIVEKAGVVDLRYETPPSSHAVVGLYCYPPDVFDVIASLEPSSRGELEITDVNRHYALQGRLDAREVEGWWEDAGKHWQHLADIGRRIDQTGANKGEAA